MARGEGGVKANAEHLTMISGLSLSLVLWLPPRHTVRARGRPAKQAAADVHSQRVHVSPERDILRRPERVHRLGQTDPAPNQYQVRKPTAPKGISRPGQV